MLAVLILVIVGLIAGLSLRDGFSGDQALFLTYAKAIKNGAVLYRDVWDIKQPGIFVFYYIGGNLFGFTEIGIHLLEIIYWLGFSLILIFTLKNYFTNPIFALLTPLFTIGIYYSVSGSLHLTQVESLVGFPLYICLWYGQKFLENPEKKSFIVLSGLFGGIVLTFKLMFLVILFNFWLCLFIFLYFSTPKRDAKQIAVTITTIFLGLMIPVSLVIFYFSFNNSLNDLWYTTFVYPYDAVFTITKMENRSQFLLGGLVWFFRSYFPVIILTLLFLFLNIKSIFKVWKNRETFGLRRQNFVTTCLFIWVFSGFSVILIQRLSWWEYHYSLLMIPLGILAVMCLERLVEAIESFPKNRRKIFTYIGLTIILLGLFIPTARRLIFRIAQSDKLEVVKIGDRTFSVTGDSMADYRTISADTEFLRMENPKTSIFVVSNPLYYYLSDLTPVFASNGAMSDMFTDIELKRLSREMSLKPPKYVYIETRLILPLTEENALFMDTVNKNYSIFKTGDRGSFYKLNFLR